MKNEILNKIKDNFFKLLIKLDNGFLCDTCKYNHHSTCLNPQRPNVKNCKEYSKK
jgi:hypothetical protein